MMAPQVINGAAHRTHGGTSFRMVNQSLILSLSWCPYRELKELARRVGIDLDVGAPIFLASFGRVIAVNRFIRTIARCPKPLLRKAILLEQVLLDLVGARVGELNIVSTSAGRVGVA